MDDIDFIKYITRISEACGILCKRMDKLEQEIDLLKHEEETRSENSCKIYNISDFNKNKQFDPLCDRNSLIEGMSF